MKSTTYLATGAFATLILVDEKAKMFTLKTDKDTMLLKTDAGTTPELRSLKSGERVKVSYENSQGEKIATTITPEEGCRSEGLDSPRGLAPRDPHT